MICLCLTGATLQENQSLIHRYRSVIGLVELRIDLLAPDALEELRHNASWFVRSCGPLPVILTCRRRADGGEYTGSESQRIELLLELLSGGFAWVDVEGDDDGLSDRQTIIRSARSRGTKVVASRHYLNDVPGKPLDVLHRLEKIGDCAKLAGMPRGNADLGRLWSAARAHHGPHVVIGMGSYGQVSRTMSKAFGNLFTFASAPDGRQAADGHLDPRRLAQQFGYRRTTERTRYFAVVGDPIAHSRSPDYHNARFERDGLDAVYVPIRVDSFPEFMEMARTVPFYGVSVTVPHKEYAARLADSTDESVRGTGACNTLVFADGHFAGYNTDVEGFLAPLRGRLPSIHGATVIGAGGAARAVTYALLSCGVSVRVCNRTLSRAEKLATLLSAVGPSVDAGALPHSATELAGYDDLIVQTTSVGMDPDVDGDPIPDYAFRGTELAYDIIYTPPKTAFLSRAARAGCSVINGAGMFDAQAEAQYRRFAGACRTA